MNKAPYIIDRQLPISQDFEELKNEALAYIQEYSGTEWTNFNPGDPGVTILEQVCYALTELGYCLDFPIKDILTTKKDKKIHIKDQFFKAEKILTTSPITINDYKKSLIDEVDGIQNVIIKPNSSALISAMGTYEVWLYVNNLSNEDTTICKAAYLHLNSNKNIGEIFGYPKILQPVTYKLQGTITLNSNTDLVQTVKAIKRAIKCAIFPVVKPHGYQTLKEQGHDINSIYNGPLLKTGCILDKQLGSKKNTLKIADAIQCIESVQEVESVSNLSFAKPGNETLPNFSPEEATSLFNEIIRVDLDASIEDELYFEYNGSTITSAKLTDSPVSSVGFDTGIDQIKSTLYTKPEIPKGSYRNIESYYSIQNTFPEIYNIGANAVNSKTALVDQAQSRQLKAYLSLFDQVLANQFSQLSHLDDLLSFKNSQYGDYADKKAFYDLKDSFEKKHIEYPAPYLKFTATYFYQSLYNIPNIRTLLRGYETFDFSLEKKSSKALQNESWKAFKNSPYNAYIHGLMDCIESPTTALERRNNILNHLLARHGQSPLLIDAIISNSIYTEDEMQDRIIFKSLYLQNFALLSYYQQRSYSYLSATILDVEIENVSLQTIQDLSTEVQEDFIFSARDIDTIEKIEINDFTNFPAIALRANLLLGLRTLYRNFIIETPLKTEPFTNLQLEKKSLDFVVPPQELINQAYWFMNYCGAIYVETALLINSAVFSLTIYYNKVKWATLPNLSFNEFVLLENLLQNLGLNKILDYVKEDQLTLNNKSYPIQFGTPINTDIIDVNLITFGGTAQWSDSFSLDITAALFTTSFLVIFPAYLFQTTEQEQRFMEDYALLIDQSLAPHISYVPATLSYEDLANLREGYIKWHNDFIYVPETSLQTPSTVFKEQNAYTIQLLEILKSIESFEPLFTAT